MDIVKKYTFTSEKVSAWYKFNEKTKKIVWLQCDNCVLRVFNLKKRETPWPMRYAVSQEKLHEDFSYSVGVNITTPVVMCSRLFESESQSYITTNGQTASLSWNKAPV
jgi:hypothetical protein